MPSRSTATANPSVPHQNARLRPGSRTHNSGRDATNVNSMDSPSHGTVSPSGEASVRIAVVALGLGAGCTGDGGKAADSGSTTADTGSALVELLDVGTACAYGDGLPQSTGTVDTTFAGGETFDVQVVLDDCASGCASEVQASCDVRFVNTEIVISATASYSVPQGDVDCPSMCVPVVATCAGDVLDAGYWVLDYGGGHSEGFTVPGTVPAPCAASLNR
jgi:hypothetical protein